MCGALCGRYAVGHLIRFQHREFLRNNFARLFSDRWVCKKPESEVLKPIGKASTNPTVSRVKLATKAKIEEILRTRLPKGCRRCGERKVWRRGKTACFSRQR